MALLFVKSKIGSKRTHSSFFNSNIINTKIPKLIENLKKFEKENLEIDHHLSMLRPLGDLLPQFYLEFENLKKVSFSAGDAKEREKNNRILRNYLKFHEAIEFEIRGYKDKKEPLYEALMAILADKKTTFDNTIDLFYKK